MSLREGGGGGRGSTLNANLTLSVIRSIFRRPLTKQLRRPRFFAKNTNKMYRQDTFFQYKADTNMISSSLTNWRVLYNIIRNYIVLLQNQGLQIRSLHRKTVSNSTLKLTNALILSLPLIIRTEVKLLEGKNNFFCRQFCGGARQFFGFTHCPTITSKISNLTLQ